MFNSEDGGGKRRGGYRTMTEIATEAIKEAVLQGHYKPGKRLIPAKLENELNLGRVAIREALRELTGSGLVVSVPNKGAIVAEAVDAEEMREVFEIRYDLEGKACELAAARISEEELSKLERLNNDLAGYQENPREYFLLNRKFHLDFYRASGWDFLCHIITQLFDRVLVFRSIHPISQDSIPSYVDHHTELLSAARDRDGARAKQIMTQHLEAGYQSFLSILKKGHPSL
ncbi:MAG: GntR family transcriptional regulator [Desulfarculaceae bacterium]|nr:GntR family transcriptional regulator [Desulfarculaceae bacterium]